MRKQIQKRSAVLFACLMACAPLASWAQGTPSIPSAPSAGTAAIQSFSQTVSPATTMAPPTPAQSFNPPSYTQPTYNPTAAGYPGPVGPGAMPTSPNNGPSNSNFNQNSMPTSQVISSFPSSGNNDDPRAIVHTSMGDFKIKLLRELAPNTVQHFIGLAKGEKEFIDVHTSKKTRRPFYNGLTFHKVVKDFLIQTGCPYGTGRGSAGDIATIKDEIQQVMKFDRPGMVAMAPPRTPDGLDVVKDSNSSQFFITLAPNPEWAGKFTIFGEIESGMDVAKKISAVKVGPTDRPIKRVFVTSIEIVEPKDNVPVAPDLPSNRQPGK